LPRAATGCEAGGLAAETNVAPGLAAKVAVVGVALAQGLGLALVGLSSAASGMVMAGMVLR
jgi:hypothetical protein